MIRQTKTVLFTANLHLLLVHGYWDWMLAVSLTWAKYSVSWGLTWCNFKILDGDGNHMNAGNTVILLSTFTGTSWTSRHSGQCVGLKSKIFKFIMVHEPVVVLNTSPLHAGWLSLACRMATVIRSIQNNLLMRLNYIDVYSYPLYRRSIPDSSRQVSWG